MYYTQLYSIIFLSAIIINMLCNTFEKYCASLEYISLNNNIEYMLYLQLSEKMSVVKKVVYRSRTLTTKL